MEKNITESIIEDDSDNYLEIDIINFNYTNTIGKVLSKQKKELYYIENIFQEVWGKRMTHIKRINEIHIHGEIQEGSAIGVNDLTQINISAIGSAEEAQNYVKQHIVDTYDDKRIDRTKNIINQSNFIIIFGCSLGDTDEIWWEHIIESMRTHQTQKVILHDFDENRSQDPRYAQSFNKENEITRKKLMKYTPSDPRYGDEIQKGIRKRIYPVINGELFSEKNSFLKGLMQKELEEEKQKEATKKDLIDRYTVHKRISQF